MKLWQKRMTSSSLLPLGSKSLPPLGYIHDPKGIDLDVVKDIKLGHDVLEPPVHLLEGPGVAHGVLTHLQAAGGHAAGVGGRIKEYADRVPGSTYTEGFRGIWTIPCDIALPCATQMLAPSTRSPGFPHSSAAV